MFKIIEKIWRQWRKYIFNKLYVFLSIVIFLLRDFFLGFENANNYLKRVSQVAIIPILKMKGACIGENCSIESGIIFHNCNNYINLSVGINCHIGKNCFFDLREKITIGNNVVIAMNNTFITHLDISNSKLSNTYPARAQPIFINDDVYIASNCNILMGVSIDEGGFVAASSLVTKNVNAFTMVGGVPAKGIKRINGI
jgi:acetyltransferase-like isoleucine patch superfamily enzyme